MVKPQMKRQVVAMEEDRDGFNFTMYATEQVVDIAKEFGSVYPLPDRKDYYIVYIDPRYDFDEVLDYVVGYPETYAEHNQELLDNMEKKVLELAKESAEKRVEKRTYRRTFRWNSDIPAWVTLKTGIQVDLKAGYFVDAATSDPGWEQHIPDNLSKVALSDKPGVFVLVDNTGE